MRIMTANDIANDIVNSNANDNEKIFPEPASSDAFTNSCANYIRWSCVCYAGRKQES